MNNDPIQVLLIDDDEDQYIILKRYFKQISQKSKLTDQSHPFELEWVATYQAAMKAIDSHGYDVILVDYSLAQIHGTQIIREAIAKGCNTPFILQTYHEEVSIDLEAMEAGAMDYLVKEQINPVLLERTIRYAIRHKQIELNLEESALFQAELNDKVIETNLKIQESKEELEKAYSQMQSDLNLAKEFQQMILPHIEIPPFLKMAERYFPFEDGVSGDIYDMALTREGDFNVFLGDAVGHGIAAGFMTMMVQMALDNIPPYLPTNTIMSQLNTLLTSRETQKHMSGVFLRITPEGLLTATIAGHPPPLILPREGSEPILFEFGGVPLGLFREEISPYKEESYQLHPGDKVVLYTDGLNEWTNAQGKMFGIKQCASFLWEHRHQDLNLMLDRLKKHLDQFSQGTPCNDDLTILGFQFRSQNTLKPHVSSPFDRKLVEENNDIVNYLKDSRIFGDLDQSIIEELLPLSTFKEFLPNTDILKEGEINSEVYFLIRGTVSIYASGEYILTLKRLGDIFGEMSIISQKPCTATVKADSYVKVFAIRARDIGEVAQMKKAKHFQNALYRLFALILTEKLSLTTKKAKQFEVANRTLFKSEALNSAILNAIPDFIFRIKMKGDLEMEFSYARETDLLDFDQSQQENLDWGKQVATQSIHYVEIVQNFESELKIVLKTGAPQTLNYQLTLPDKKQHSFETRLTRIENYKEILVVVHAGGVLPEGTPPQGDSQN